MERVSLELSTELLARVDAERGMVPRNRWIRWAVEEVLGDPPGRIRQERREANRPVRSSAQASPRPKKGER